MRNVKFAKTLIFILTAIVIVFTLAMPAFATGELGTLTPPVETQETYVDVDTQTQPPTQEQTEYVDDTDEDTDYDDGDDGGYIEETEPETEPPTYYEVYGDELPQVSSQEVTEPTTMEIPDVEVSDTSLLGGVIAWLCVAVGIAVIAGVLVSQRTRQNGTGSKKR